MTRVDATAGYFSFASLGWRTRLGVAVALIAAVWLAVRLVIV